MAYSTSILLIDDEPDFTEMMQMRLESRNYEVDVAHDGMTGLKKAAEGRPDIILLDIMMPEMDGFEVLRRLRQNQATKRTPVIMLTAKGDTNAIFKAQDAGADEYIIKPCDAAKLDRLIHKHIRPY
ncbi:MAG: response regulator [Candidatus Pacebacteria bacterium]|nr:response regulator [Candidatus Paceibacterota bacterium]